MTVKVVGLVSLVGSVLFSSELFVALYFDIGINFLLFQKEKRKKKKKF
jgi:hypothetical protein